MEEAFKIYVDRLSDGTVEHLDETFPSGFLIEGKEEFSFEPDVKVSGEAYVAEQELILHLNLSAVAIVPCAICNEPVKVPVEVQGFYHAESLEETRSGVYCYRDLLRETILLEVPQFVECEGHCPKREDFVNYLSDPDKKVGKNNNEEEGYKPFADLGL